MNQYQLQIFHLMCSFKFKETIEANEPVNVTLRGIGNTEDSENSQYILTWFSHQPWGILTLQFVTTVAVNIVDCRVF